MLTILVLGLGLMVCLPELAKAAPMGTAFTYQGRLLDANSPAEGIYDAIFVLLDSPEGPNELGITEIQNFEVFDGYFTVELDFGSNVFDGSERWLEVYVRPGDFNDPCGHTHLWPRQKITPTPYALYAKSTVLDVPLSISGLSSEPIIRCDNDGSGHGIWGENQAGNHGVLGHSYAGVFGYGESNWGVYGYSSENRGVYGNGSPGVRGESSNRDGIVGWTGASDKSGVFGESQVGTGVTGRSEAASGYGVAGMAPGSNGRGVYGNATASNGVGVYGHSDQGTGVEGRSPNADGVVGWTAASGKSGVFGHSQVGIGVSGRSDGDAGVTAVTTSTNPGQAALVARNEGSGPAIYAESGTNGLAAVFNGTIKTNVLEITGGSDLSEQFDVNGRGDEVKPGMVVSIDPQNPGKLVVSNKAYDRRVVGIISGAGGIKPGMFMGQKGSKADGTNPVALTGRAYCRADASYGKIQPGDLLTTSDTPGHAMKVADHTKAQGAVLGKAMSALEEGRGLVLVLVTLQ
jgi:hypothetical protein